MTLHIIFNLFSKIGIQQAAELASRKSKLTSFYRFWDDILDDFYSNKSFILTELQPFLDKLIELGFIRSYYIIFHCDDNGFFHFHTVIECLGDKLPDVYWNFSNRAVVKVFKAKKEKVSQDSLLSYVNKARIGWLSNNKKTIDWDDLELLLYQKYFPTFGGGKKVIYRKISKKPTKNYGCKTSARRLQAVGRLRAFLRTGRSIYMECEVKGKSLERPFLSAFCRDRIT